MADYLVYLYEGADDSNSAGSAVLRLKDPWVGANTWSISSPNAWIGTGSGIYKVGGIKPIGATIICYLGSNESRDSFKLQLQLQSYPGDLNGSGSGRGFYMPNSPAAEAKWLRWYRGYEIRKEPA